MLNIAARAAVAVVITAFVVGPAVAGAPLRIDFRNQSTVTVTRLGVRIAGSKDWGGNRLEGKGLAAGARTQILLADGADKCVVDMSIHTSDGRDKEIRVSLCGNPHFVFHGRSRRRPHHDGSSSPVEPNPLL